MIGGHWHLAESREGSLKCRSYWSHGTTVFLMSSPMACDMRICYQAFQNETVITTFTKGLLQLELEHPTFNKFVYI